MYLGMGWKGPARSNDVSNPTPVTCLHQGPGRNPRLSPSKRDVWVVPLLLRKLANAVYEREGSAKVGKREGLRDVVPLNHIPSLDLPLQRGEFLTL